MDWIMRMHAIVCKGFILLTLQMQPRMKVMGRARLVNKLRITM